MRDVAIVGLPASGKSTVWRAVTRARAAPSGPHVGVLRVPDPRVEALARLHGSRRAVHAQVRVEDTPGFGSHALARAREAHALAVVLRGFGEDVDLARDLERFRSELVVADLATVEKALERARRQAKSGAPEHRREVELYERAEALLSDGRWLAEGDWAPGERRGLALLTPLTLKPLLRVVNLDDSAPEDPSAVPGQALVVRGRLEAEAAELDEDEAAELVAAYGIAEPAPARFARAVWEVLDLVTFYTANENEAHAWEVPRGSTALQAAERVHTDLARGFVRCEVVACDDLLEAGSREAARERGLVRLEGRDYVVRPGDVLHVRHA